MHPQQARPARQPDPARRRPEDSPQQAGPLLGRQGGCLQGSHGWTEQKALQDQRKTRQCGIIQMCRLGRMSLSRGGTIILAGKVYNISQINSVYTGTVKRHKGVWGLWAFCGFIGIFAIQIPALWIILTIGAFIAALIVSNMEDYAVFFDMSSGKVAAYSDPDRSKVEEIMNDITMGLEEGYFPNYLQNR